jgi:hypothetical protein
MLYDRVFLIYFIRETYLMTENKVQQQPLHLEDIAAIAVALFDDEQRLAFVRKINPVKVTETSLSLLNLPQSIELSARVAAHGIEGRYLGLIIGIDEIDNGILDYKVTGKSEYLEIIVEEMASRGNLPFEQDPNFHRVSAIITAAQMVVNDLGPEDPVAQGILKRGQELASLTPGTRERAEATKDFLDDMFEYLERNLPGGKKDTAGTPKKKIK